mmetsp:Transcript_83177/g.121792  ORF Transcript_83177/g.121792 Transcript_83177/m.121792 type:complete len:586 (+) Transcript_83177:83-1840(+)
MMGVGTLHVAIVSVLLFTESYGFQAPLCISQKFARAPFSQVHYASKLLVGNALLRPAQVDVWNLKMSSAPETVAEGEQNKNMLLPRNPGKSAPKKSGAAAEPSRVRGMSKGEVDPILLDKAFTAFADTLLQKKGRVRFHRINESFRKEFPQWGEDVLSSQTLGRRVQIWFEDKYGESLTKSGSGAYIGLTVLNPQYVSLDMSRIRAVQAEVNPENAKIMKLMGIPVKKAQKMTGSTATTPKARANKNSKKIAPAPVGEPGGLDRVRQRLGSIGPSSGLPAGAPGGVERVNQRLGSMSPEQLNVAARIGSGGAEPGTKKSKKYPGTDTKLEALEPTLVLCVDAFANSLLVPDGHVTFKEVFAAFKAQFPLLADEKHMAPNFLGAHLRDWYQAKYHKELVRAKITADGESTANLLKRRSSLPYQGLSIMPDPSKADVTLMNEAKVALRRALKMEGVGIMVRRNKGGNFVVATIMPGSPASLLGQVEAEDVLLAVGGIETDGMSAQQLADAVLGPRGSSVSVTLRRSTVQREVDGATHNLDRVYSVELVRSDKPITQPRTPEIKAAERYASSLASSIDTNIAAPSSSS